MAKFYLYRLLGGEEKEEIKIVVDSSLIREGLFVYPPFPNPFEDVVCISFALNYDVSNVSLRMYTLDGCIVWSKDYGPMKKGYYTKNPLRDDGSEKGDAFIWDGTNFKGIKVASGIYVFLIEADSYFKGGRLYFLRTTKDFIYYH